MTQYQNETLNEREKTHGDFELTAAIACRLKETWRQGAVDAGKANSIISDVQFESLDMICTKIARIVSGNHNCKDSWEDIAGYANLVSERLK